MQSSSIYQALVRQSSGSRQAVVTCHLVINKSSDRRQAVVKVIRQSLRSHQAVIKDLRSFLKNVLKSFFRRPADRVWLSYFSPRLLTNFHCPICGLYCSSQCYWHWDWTRNLAPCKVGLERTSYMSVQTVPDTFAGHVWPDRTKYGLYNALT